MVKKPVFCVLLAALCTLLATALCRAAPTPAPAAPTPAPGAAAHGAASVASPTPKPLPQESDYYRILTLATPQGTSLEAGSLVFMGPDKLAASDRYGDIYIGTGVLGDPSKVKWSLYASGLHEVLGLAYKDGWLYATQRPELTRIRDSKGTGRADTFETVTDDWGINGDYHEYAFSSKFDRDGCIWILLTLTGSVTSESPLRGFGLRVAPDGTATPVVSGIRSPGGLGFNAAGDLFYTDNQGYWNGTCVLHQLRPGAFEGDPVCFRWFDDPATKERLARAGLKKPVQPIEHGRIYQEAKRIPNLDVPAIYFPYRKMGQSASGIACDMSGGKFGPFEDQLFIGDQMASTVMRVFLEKVNGRYQGACFPFREGFDSGNLSLQFAGDGSLFVYGTDRGWTAVGGKDYALQRLVWTGKVPFEVKEMRAAPDGFDLVFTQPVDPASAAKVASYTIKSYTYIYQSSYGSPEVDITSPVIKSVGVSPDRLSAHMVVDGLVPGHIHELHLSGVRSARGDPLLHDAAYYTLNNLPAR
jgi:glucose/arabinose dehydrogenase